MKPCNEQAAEKTTGNAKNLQRESRKLVFEAKEIEVAVYDLIAADPNIKPLVDFRTPEMRTTFCCGRFQQG